MNSFKVFLYITIGLIFASFVHSTDPPLFPNNQLFETGEFTQALPQITCDVDDFRFSQVLEGIIVTHTYKVKNSGDALLQILKVKTGCGCSTVSYDNEILPGKSGNITLRINTDGYGGKQYNEIIHVMTNDPNTPDFKLTASGPVASLAIFSPKGVSFKGKCTSLHEALVTITPNNDYSFEITGINLGNLKDKIACTLTKKESAYVLSVLNQMKTPGRYWGKIILNTDHQTKKQLDLWVSANLK
jgi:hypothetical protein